MALPKWQNVGASVGNSSADQMAGSNLIMRALENASGALTDHRQEQDKAFWKQQENMAAKLLDIKKDRPLTEEDYQLAGIVNRKPLNDEIRKRETADRDYNLNLRKTNSDIAANGAKMDPMTKALQEHALKLDFLKAETDAGKYKTKNSSGKSGVFKVLDDANLLFDPLDNGKSTVDGDADAVNKDFVALATAKNVPKNILREVIMANTQAGGWMSHVSGLDEQSLDVEGAAQMLINKGYRI